jgi:prepilin signal peptidase PulO-like enzyme (type II secretory pathway)
MTLETLGLIITVIMGLGWGSFATMATYRIPRGRPWIGDRPRCVSCGHELYLIDYFSLFSYLILRGSCRYCGVKYGCRLSYFVTELSITFLFVLCYLKYGFSDLFVLLTLLVVAAIVLAVVDAEHKRIPVKILLCATMIALVYRTFMDQTFYGALYGAILGAALGIGIRFLYFYAIGKKEIGLDYAKWQLEDRFAGPGFDYVKLLAISGILLPMHQLIIFTIICGVAIFIWRLMSVNSLRLGSIMSVALVFMVIYPGLGDYFYNHIFIGFFR